jgi:hypothetical protein
MQEMPRPPPAIMMTLRLWLEVMGPQQSEWRGEIKNLTTGEARYFRRWEEMADIVRSMLADRGTPYHASNQDG